MSLFPEEQLDSPVGYFPAYPGQTLSNDRWKIIRKFGWGPRSSTWLALDNKATDTYQAIKIFTVTATEDSSGKNERDLLRGPLKTTTTTTIESGVPVIVDDFYEQDAKGKKHLCLVLDLLGSSVEDVRLGNIYDGEYLPLHSVKKIIGDISKILASLGEQKIVHGAVTADNFHFWSIQADVDIRKELAKSPTHKPVKILGGDGITYPSVKSQPFWSGFTWDCTAEDILRAELTLANYARARQMATSVPLDSRENFLPPEALQAGGKISTKSDIWMLGCTTYLLLTGTPLFSDSYIESPTKTATETLGKLESLLTESKKLAEKDISPTVMFLRSCLAIKPANRVTAEEIFNGNWITKCECSCGWCG